MELTSNFSRQGTRGAPREEGYSHSTHYLDDAVFVGESPWNDTGPQDHGLSSSSWPVQKTLTRFHATECASKIVKTLALAATYGFIPHVHHFVATDILLGTIGRSQMPVLLWASEEG